jgi:hypothetical protein
LHGVIKSIATIERNRKAYYTSVFLFLRGGEYQMIRTKTSNCLELFAAMLILDIVLAIHEESKV